MVKLLQSNKTIAIIYSLANSPYMLYEQMRNHLAFIDPNEYSTKELIEQFTELSGSIKNTSDIAALYALFILLTFKERKEVEAFFKDALQIQFEWFKDIAKIYLSDGVATTIRQDVISSSILNYESQLLSPESEIQTTVQ